MGNHVRAEGPHQPEDARISWHQAFVEAIQVVLGPYREILQFMPEFHLANTVEERVPGIYTVVGDLIPIQVIDNRKLAGAENIWLKGLDNQLDVEQINQLAEEKEQLGGAVRVGTYFDVITRANTEKVKEAYQMSTKSMGIRELLEEIGVTAEYEARGEARNKVVVAKNLIKIGLSPEKIAQATELDLVTVQSLTQS
jgi:predicted transposase YdaD